MLHRISDQNHVYFSLLQYFGLNDTSLDSCAVDIREMKLDFFDYSSAYYLGADELVSNFRQDHRYGYGR